MSVPKLRFTEFNLPYKLTELGDALIGYSLGGNYANSCDVTSNPLIKMGNLGRGYINTEKVEYIQNNEMITDDNKLEIGDLLFNTRNTLDLVGKVAIWRGELERAYFNSNIMRMVFDNNYYMNYALNTKKSLTKLKAIASGTTSVAAIYTKDLKKIKIWIPSIKEQTKISDFLSSVDDKITLLNKQYDLLCRYKKEMLQKVFSQELRFKDDSGDDFSDWEEVALKNIASKVNTKNRDNLVSTVLTNSATQGIVSQESYFEREIVTESNLKGYYVVKIGDFVYNPRISSTAPVGPIKMNELTQGVMSPLYTVFRFEKGLLKFYQYFFESSVWHDYMKSVANSGARHDRMNISGADFFDLPVPKPSDEEQTKIARFISAIDDKITTKKTELENLKTWKQGLLQQLFV
ncbi:TPA: restriction endonuclease subunit S [Klebsiella quasipneumoniae subsp. similipneumoniae]|uniref:restriction endonuclease subunit S n=1 Tax=Klebsiella quasipneumoniae TaxID=1463165 RepID=UPI0015DD4BFF|nr:restriction endonuclease subunit S [Klebsiella quasipneumoniae]GJK19783.1 type I restriction endonuclease [Klebsiella pneumoniae]HBS3683223.1 restriction endonuclease subunit S [Klebsiella quasipneumoniae subsp. similipneumoniae]MCX2313818.1 restriction endonuclease subunit S [Klebsiella quasipneumoniae]BBS49298.1 type I restriction endonuclease [Klebsiella quasipneumoniae]HCI5912150.1 restriction endonuclease subunit S [Klebsiella quasipneumoniae subsp. similipneumoniae]